MTTDCEVVGEGEWRDSFIYPLVFIFCFEKRAELGGPVRVEEGARSARRMMGKWTWKTRPTKQPAL